MDPTGQWLVSGEILILLFDVKFLYFCSSNFKGFNPLVHLVHHLDYVYSNKTLRNAVVLPCCHYSNVNCVIV